MHVGRSQCERFTGMHLYHRNRNASQPSECGMYPLTQPPLSIIFDTKYKPLLYSMVLPVGTDSRLSGHRLQALSTPIYSATCDCNVYSHLGTANVHSMRQITMHHRGTFSVGSRHVHTCGRLWAVRMCTVYMPDARRGRPRSWEGRSEAPPATPEKASRTPMAAIAVAVPYRNAPDRVRTDDYCSKK